MSTDLASTGNIILDPTLPFGLVKTTAKTVTYFKSEYPAISNTKTKSGSFYSNICYFKNFIKPTGVTFIPRIKIRVKVPTHLTRYIYLENLGATGADLAFGFQAPGDSYFSNIGKTWIGRLIDGSTGSVKSELTVPVNDSVYWSPTDWSAGDIVEIEVDIDTLENYAFRTIADADFGTLEFDIFYEISATIYHDGSLTRGEGVTCSFDLVDEDGTTLIAKYEFDGVVSPYDFGRHDVFDTYKAGFMKSIVAPIGTWSLKSGVTGVYARLRLDDVKVGGVSKGITEIESLFDTLEIDFMHKDEYENIVSMPVCELITGGVLKQSAIPFESADELLPDGKGGNCAVVVYVKPLKVSEIIGQRIEINTSLWIVM